MSLLVFYGVLQTLVMLVFSTQLCEICVWLEGGGGVELCWRTYSAGV
jgi:hypothetical protein